MAALSTAYTSHPHLRCKTPPGVSLLCCSGRHAYVCAPQVWHSHVCARARTCVSVVIFPLLPCCAPLAGAVRACKEAASGQQSGSSQPLWVLDVGAGTGLLSLMAAQAGAPAVIGTCGIEYLALCMRCNLTCVLLRSAEARRQPAVIGVRASLSSALATTTALWPNIAIFALRLITVEFKHLRACVVCE